MLNHALALAPAAWLGELLRSRRYELGYSQRDLASLVCMVSGRPTITRNEISRYERETRIPTRTTVAELAEALQLPALWLHQASGCTRLRRSIVAKAPHLLHELRPGYDFGPGNNGQAQPMIFIDPDAAIEVDQS